MAFSTSCILYEVIFEQVATSIFLWAGSVHVQVPRTGTQYMTLGIGFRNACNFIFNEIVAQDVVRVRTYTYMDAVRRIPFYPFLQSIILHLHKCFTSTVMRTYDVFLASTTVGPPGACFEWILAMVCQGLAYTM